MYTTGENDPWTRRLCDGRAAYFLPDAYESDAARATRERSARMACFVCPLLDGICLDLAIARPDIPGIVAGMDPQQRAKIAA